VTRHSRPTSKSPGRNFARAGFSFMMPVIHTGNHRLYIYGHSAVTGIGRVVAIPFIVSAAEAPESEGVTPIITSWVLP
jgi:hypothetical protein